MDLDNEETMMKEKGVYATGGLIGAILASTCCIAPFVFLLLGISGAWISYLTALAPYQPIVQKVLPVPLPNPSASSK